MIVVANPGIGNFVSISNMLKHLDVDFEVRATPGQIKDISHLILPGVGSFDAGINALEDSGWSEEIHRLSNTAFVLGICLGMQLLSKGSDEGVLQGLSIVDARCKKLDSKKEKVPHIGWGHVHVHRPNPLITSLELQKFYFSHSYFVDVNKEELTCGVTSYGEKFTSVLQQDNIFGVQFHPEKSHRFGATLLKNFVELK